MCQTASLLDLPASKASSKVPAHFFRSTPRYVRGIGRVALGFSMGAPPADHAPALRGRQEHRPADIEESADQRNDCAHSGDTGPQVSRCEGQDKHGATELPHDDVIISPRLMMTSSSHLLPRANSEERWRERARARGWPEVRPPLAADGDERVFGLGCMDFDEEGGAFKHTSMDGLGGPGARCLLRPLSGKSGRTASVELERHLCLTSKPACDARVARTESGQPFEFLPQSVNLDRWTADMEYSYRLFSSPSDSQRCIISTAVRESGFSPMPVSKLDPMAVSRQEIKEGATDHNASTVFKLFSKQNREGPPALVTAGCGGDELTQTFSGCTGTVVADMAEVTDDEDGESETRRPRRRDRTRWPALERVHAHAREHCECECGCECQAKRQRSE